MKRDMDFIRDSLLDIEEKAEPLEFYPVNLSMLNKGYEKNYIMAQLLIMENARLFDKVAKDLNYGFAVCGLSNTGYDFLETIRNEKIWEQTKNEIQEKKLPKTIKFIAEVAGIFCGELLKHKNGGSNE